MDGEVKKCRRLSLSKREIVEYLRSHSAEQILAEINEFHSHVEAIGISMSDLWKEYRIPLFIVGEHWEVTGYYMGSPFQSIQIGPKKSMMDKIKEAENGAEECRNPGEERNGRA